MKLAIYSIMRNEADNVMGWLESTEDADDRYVLDTGSDDNTVDTLMAHAVDFDVARFDPFRFDDARNTALAHVNDDVDLCLRLDADERLSAGWRDALERVYQPGVERYRYRVVNHGRTWGMHTRDDCHGRFGFRWRYPTHEVLDGPRLTIDVPGMIVHHQPPLGRRPHHDNNLAVLAAEASRSPGDHRMAFYYARECWYTGDWVRCRTEMVRFLNLPGGWGPERAEAYRILASIDTDPERWLWKAIGEAPERREPWVDLARLFLVKDQAGRAYSMLIEAALRDDMTVYTTDQRAWGEAFEALRSEVTAACS